MSLLNTDTSSQLDIIAVCNHSMQVTLKHFQNDGITPLPLTGTYKMTISKDADGKFPVLELTVGSGLTIDNNELTIAVTKLQNNLDARVYHYGIRVDKEDGSSFPAFYGTYTLKPNVPKP